MEFREAGGVVLAGFHQLAASGLIRHGIASRIGGTSDPPFRGLNLGLRSGDDPDRVRENRRRFAAALGIDAGQVVAGRQVHGAGIAVVGADDAGRGAIEADTAVADTDALVTDCSGVALLLLVADCTPVLLLDPVRPAIATVHAGWRGTVRRIVAETVDRMEATFGTQPADLIAGIGPVIGPCCYEVDDPVIAGIRAAQPDDAPDLLKLKPNGRAQLDLAEANRRQLLRAGVRPERIEVAGICTACTTALFYSERREGRPSGRFGALMMIDSNGMGT
ncbi:MAG TPA: peptidoglycan editing factor PgeF [Dehalococcoidia bacterium]|nr:peptidoglycan editing factor PgeF [Dehalococcoidia bacterium]